MSARSVFPLRFHDETLRDLVREVAKRDHVSQNDLIEQAVQNEVVARGAALARDLAQAASRLAELSDAALEKLVQRSVAEAGAEGAPEPLQAVALHTTPDPPTAAPHRAAMSPPVDRLGVMAAFDAGRHA